MGVIFVSSQGPVVRGLKLDRLDVFYPGNPVVAGFGRQRTPHPKNKGLFDKAADGFFPVGRHGICRNGKSTEYHNDRYDSDMAMHSLIQAQTELSVYWGAEDSGKLKGAYKY